MPLKSKTHPTLAQWVKRQRYQYVLREQGKRSSLNDDRLALLQQIGFVWQAQEAHWQERFKDLLEFKKQHGHCKVPTRYHKDKSLGSWVKCQRTQYRKYKRNESCNINKERILQLDSLGFAWEGRDMS